MRLIQQGDQVQVHYVKHFGDGSVVSSRDRTPTALTVGVDHPRLPGLGLALLGMAVGESRTVVLPAPGAYGPHEARKIHTLARARFAGSGPLSVGAWVRVWVRRHRRRLVRIVEISEEAVVIDANHRWAGQSVEMEVQVVAVHDPDAAPGAGHAVEGYAVDPGQGVREDHWLDDGGQQ